MSSCWNPSWWIDMPSGCWVSWYLHKRNTMLAVADIWRRRLSWKIKTVVCWAPRRKRRTCRLVSAMPSHSASTGRQSTMYVHQCRNIWHPYSADNCRDHDCTARVGCQFVESVIAARSLFWIIPWCCSELSLEALLVTFCVIWEMHMLWIRYSIYYVT